VVSADHSEFFEIDSILWKVAHEYRSLALLRIRLTVHRLMRASQSERDGLEV
jgi:hypothetical protein